MSVVFTEDRVSGHLDSQCLVDVPGWEVFLRLGCSGCPAQYTSLAPRGPGPGWLWTPELISSPLSLLSCLIALLADLQQVLSLTFPELPNCPSTYL